MYWTGERPFYHKDAFLQLKFGLDHMTMFFSFYSQNEGLSHYGRSEIMPLLLDNGSEDLSVWTHQPEEAKQPEFPVIPDVVIEEPKGPTEVSKE